MAHREITGPSVGRSETSSAPVSSVTSLLLRWSEGDPTALNALMPLVYDELRKLAEHHMRGERAWSTTPRTGLVHEAYLRLANAKALDLRGRAQFFGLASTMMRHILVDHARERRAGKRGGGATMESLNATTGLGVDGMSPQVQAALSVPDDSLDLIALNESLQRLEALDPQQGRVVEMRFFVGMSVEETADAMQLSPATIKREWATARAWLLRDMGADTTRSGPSNASE